MPEGKHKSRTMRRVFTKTPGGRVVLHYSLKKPKKSRCHQCGALLAGVARERPVGLSKLSKTEKRPERPYAGVLCAKCTRVLFKEKARAQ